MNSTIIVMFLASIGFILIGIFLLNNKYLKNQDVEDKEILNEIKTIKVSGYVNILIGLIGIISSTICLFNNSLIKSIVIIFVISIVILSSIQYLFSKKNK